MTTLLSEYGRQLHEAVRRNAKVLSSTELSQIINFSRITLIVGLVFLHYESYPNSAVSPFRGMDPTQNQIATFINSFILFFFFSVVPLLSMISGWLFFSFKDSPVSALIDRIRRRFVSLYLPLVFWNVFFLSLLLLTFFLNPTYPLLKQMNIDFGSAQPMEYVNAIFGITKHPVGFQFWFVRDLFVTVLVSPLLWLALTRAPFLGAIVLGAAWIRGFDLWIFFRTDVVFFFFLGGLIRTRKIPVEVGRRTALVFLGIYVALVALRTLAPYLIDGDTGLLDAATRAMRLVGVVACWGVFQQIALTNWGSVVARYGGFAFFLHAAHYPLLAEVKIILWGWVPAPTQPWMLAHYAASVAVTVAIGVALGVIFTRTAPRLFALLNGGRMVG